MMTTHDSADTHTNKHTAQEAAKIMRVLIHKATHTLALLNHFAVAATSTAALEQQDSNSMQIVGGVTYEEHFFLFAFTSLAALSKCIEVVNQINKLTAAAAAAAGGGGAGTRTSTQEWFEVCESMERLRDRARDMMRAYPAVFMTSHTHAHVHPNIASQLRNIA